MTNDEVQQTLGDLAARGPVVRGILLGHLLDFGHSGELTLGAACAARELPSRRIEAIVAELQKATRAGHEDAGERADWDQASVAELIDHIVDRYHRPLTGQLRGIVFAAEQVERIHSSEPGCPSGLAAHLHELHVDLASHMVKEERVLFPALLSGRRGPALSAPITTMMTAHGDHGLDLKQTRELTGDFYLPDGACATWSALYEQLSMIESDLLRHSHLENDVLFPRVLQR